MNYPDISNTSLGYTPSLATNYFNMFEHSQMYLTLPTSSAQHKFEDNLSTDGSDSGYSYQSNVNQKKSQNNFQIKIKTELCKSYQLRIPCEYGDKCSFAHGYQELKPKVHIPQNYKTTKCKQYYEEIYCKFGSRCQFAHKSKKINQLDNNYSSYGLFLQGKLKLLKDFQQMNQEADLLIMLEMISLLNTKSRRLQNFEQITLSK